MNIPKKSIFSRRSKNDVHVVESREGRLHNCNQFSLQLKVMVVILFLYPCTFCFAKGDVEYPCIIAC